MKTTRFSFAALISIMAIVSAAESRADQNPACAHPALARGATCMAQPGIDANTFIVLPPASTHWVVRPASKNGDHPAVVVARLQRSTVVDANTFIVLPPVAVNWTVQQEPTLWAGTSVAGTR